MEIVHLLSVFSGFMCISLTVCSYSSCFHFICVSEQDLRYISVVGLQLWSYNSLIWQVNTLNFE